MHSRATVVEALTLRDAGLGARRIAKRMGLPVETVRDWLAGRLPKHSRGPHPAAVPTCGFCGHSEHDFFGLDGVYVYLLGLYLGDGSLVHHRRGVYRLRITLDVRYPGIIDSAACAVGQVRQAPALVLPRRHQNCVDVSSFWKSWPWFFPQHGPGKKQDRSIALAHWQRELVDRWPDQLLRGLINSDGCRFINTGRAGWRWPRYTFSQRSSDIRGMFTHTCDLTCDLMGLHWSQAGKHTIYVSRKADVAILDKFIGPKR